MTQLDEGERLASAIERVDSFIRHFEALTAPVRHFSDTARALVQGFTSARMRLYRRQFSATGSVVYAWAAFHCARRSGLEPPEWVLEYLEEVAKRMVELGKAPPERIGTSLATALGMVRGAGRGTDLSRFRDFEMMMDVARDVAHRMESGESLTAAQHSVAEARSIDSSTVRRYCAQALEIAKLALDEL